MQYRVENNVFHSCVSLVRHNSAMCGTGLRSASVQIIASPPPSNLEQTAQKLQHDIGRTQSDETFISNKNSQLQILINGKKVPFHLFNWLRIDNNRPNILVNPFPNDKF